MAGTRKTPKQLLLGLKTRNAVEDDYEHYMQAVLRQAIARPEVSRATKGNHR